MRPKRDYQLFLVLASDFRLSDVTVGLAQQTGEMVAYSYEVSEP